MRIALTGASGFIGSYIARALAEAGHSVRALVREESRRDHLLDSVDEFLVGTHDQSEVAHDLICGVDAVIHNSVDWLPLRQEDAMGHFQSNLLGSLTLLDAARAAGCDQFLFISSVATHHEIVTTPTITETHPLRPGNLYGAYKAAVEAHLHAYHHKYGMNTSAWRPAAVYGLDPDLPRSQWHDLILKVRDGGTIENDRGGKITHVQDIADAMACAVGDAAVAGEVFNLAEQYLYWQRVAEWAKELTGSSATIVDRAGAGPKNSFSTEKARAFFDRHGRSEAFRRGDAGVRDYVADLLAAVSDRQGH